MAKRAAARIMAGLNDALALAESPLWRAALDVVSDAQFEANHAAQPGDMLVKAEVIDSLRAAVEQQRSAQIISSTAPAERESSREEH